MTDKHTLDLSAEELVTLFVALAGGLPQALSAGLDEVGSRLDMMREIAETYHSEANFSPLPMPTIKKIDLGAHAANKPGAAIEVVEITPPPKGGRGKRKKKAAK